MRISPTGKAYQAWDSDPEPLFMHVVDRLNELQVSWLDLVEGDTGVTRTVQPSFDLQKLRRSFRGPVIANNPYTRERALAARRNKTADLIAFSVPFIAKPDLVERLRPEAPFSISERTSYYGGVAAGYTDYPTLGAQAGRSRE